MTRRVNFSPQQRVDQPDAQAISAFGAQDLRRVLRNVVMGNDVAANVGRVLSGFAVEAENPGVSSRVIIKLDQGGGVLGSFMGAIDQGGGLIDWGQLAGGKDGLGNLEGSAQNLLDFGGQPVAVYQVKARTTFVPGVLDNRAFWNPASNAEFIKPTNTRLVPQWEVAFQGHAAADWVLLASVDWDGVAVAANDIVDLRSFPVEGQPRNVGFADEQWSHAAQNDGDTYGVGDFDRDEDRGDAGLYAVWDALRALGRQVQDLKGGRESDFRFDWFSRVFAPPGFLAADPSDKSTKTLRSVDVITFTVADGTTEQGDFNGVNALNDCLKFIEDNEGDLPERIHIIAKGREESDDFTWDSAVTIAGKTISIVGLGGSWVFTPTSGLGRGLTVVDPSAAPIGGGALLTMTNGSHLHVENIYFDQQPAAAVEWIVCDISSRFSCKNILMSANSAGEGPGIGAVLRVPSQGLLIEESLIGGNTFIGGKTDPGFTHYTSQDKMWTSGLARNSYFGALVRTRHSDPSGTDETERWLFADRLRFEACSFQETVSQQTGGAAEHGQIDITGARNLAFEHCDFSYHGDQTCIWGTTETVDAGAWQSISGINIHDCDFRITVSATHPGTLSGAGGASGADGTGWAVAIKATRIGDNVVNAQQIPTRISIERNRFSSGLAANEASFIATSPDAGAIVVQDCSRVWVKRNDFRWWTKPTGGNASDVQSIARISGTIAGLSQTGASHTWVENNFFGDVYESGGVDWNGIGRFIFLDLFGLSGVQVSGNTITATNFGGTIGQDFNPTDPTALVVDTCLEVNVHHNRFLEFRDTNDPLQNTCVGLRGLNFGIRFDHNEFANCGGANIVAETGHVGVDLAFNCNIFLVGTDNALFESCVDLGTLGTSALPVIFIGNWWNHTGASTDAIILDTSSTIGMISGNMFYTGFVRILGIGGGAGVQHAQLAGYAPRSGFTVAGGDNHDHSDQYMNIVAGYV